MAARGGDDTEAALMSQYRNWLRVWRESEPGSAESDDAKERLRRIKAQLKQHLSDESYIHALAEYMEVERERKKKKKKDHRCAVMATGGNVSQRLRLTPHDHLPLYQQW